MTSVAHSSYSGGGEAKILSGSFVAQIELFASFGNSRLQSWYLLWISNPYSTHTSSTTTDDALRS